MREYNIGDAVLNGWTITQEIGSGSFGRVVEVTKSEYGITAVSALKIITVPSSPTVLRAIRAEGMDEASTHAYFRGIVDNLASEIAIMSQLKSHPGIVNYEDHEITEYDDEVRWDILLRMEKLTCLTDYLSAQPVNVQQVLKMGIELSDALAYCHERGIIHRDVKLDNIFLDDMGRAKLGDFGVAKTLEVLSQAMSRKGTETYMAPELFRGDRYDSSVDTYALGLVLYRMLNDGRLPFMPPLPQKIAPQDREQAIMRRMRGDYLPDPAHGGVGLANIIRRACAPSPANRFQSAAEMHKALQGLAGSGPAAVQADPMFVAAVDSRSGSYGSNSASNPGPSSSGGGQASVAASSVCPRCGRPVAVNAAFCGICGCPLGKQQYAPASDAPHVGQQPVRTVQNNQPLQGGNQPQGEGKKSGNTAAKIAIIVALALVVIVGFGFCSRGGSGSTSHSASSESAVQDAASSTSDQGDVTPVEEEDDPQAEAYSAYAEALQKVLDLSGEGQIETSGGVSYIKGVSYAALVDVDGDGMDEMLVATTTGDLEACYDYGQVFLYDYKGDDVSKFELGLCVWYTEDYTGEEVEYGVYAAGLCYQADESLSCYKTVSYSKDLFSDYTAYARSSRICDFDFNTIASFYNYKSPYSTTYEVDDVEVDEDTFEQRKAEYDSMPYYAIVSEDAADLDASLEGLATVKAALGME